MEKYIPDIYQKSIYDIDYQKLIDRGIQCLLIDLDNTIVGPSIKVINEKTKDLFQALKEQGFRVILCTNASVRRAELFANELGVEYYARAYKPSTKAFKKIMEKYHLEESEVAMIGDQLLTDILGGNRVGITTILVNPMSNRDGFPTFITRIYEGHLFRKMRKHDIFTKGKYYD